MAWQCHKPTMTDLGCCRWPVGLVIWNMLDYDCPLSWECHHPNWRTPSFFRGVDKPPTTPKIAVLECFRLNFCGLKPHLCKAGGVWNWECAVVVVSLTPWNLTCKAKLLVQCRNQLFVPIATSFLWLKTQCFIRVSVSSFSRSTFC